MEVAGDEGVFRQPVAVRPWPHFTSHDRSGLYGDTVGMINAMAERAAAFTHNRPRGSHPFRGFRQPLGVRNLFGPLPVKNRSLSRKGDPPRGFPEYPYPFPVHIHPCSVCAHRRTSNKFHEPEPDGPHDQKIRSFFPTTLLSGYSIIPSAPASISRGMSSRTTSSPMTDSTESHSAL